MIICLLQWDYRVGYVFYSTDERFKISQQEAQLLLFKALGVHNRRGEPALWEFNVGGRDFKAYYFGQFSYEPSVLLVEGSSELSEFVVLELAMRLRRKLMKGAMTQEEFSKVIPNAYLRLIRNLGELEAMLLALSNTPRVALLNVLTRRRLTTFSELADSYEAMTFKLSHTDVEETIRLFQLAGMVEITNFLGRRYIEVIKRPRLLLDTEEVTNPRVVSLIAKVFLMPRLREELLLLLKHGEVPKQSVKRLIRKLADVEIIEVRGDLVKLAKRPRFEILSGKEKIGEIVISEVGLRLEKS